jgi:hypothetical protein
LKKTEVVVTPDLTPPPTKGELPPAEVREAAAAVASTTTTVAATSTTAVTNEATSQEKPTAVPTAKQIDAVPDAPAGTPMTTKKSYTEGDKVSFTQPGFEPNSWVQVVVSPPTKILQTVQASSTGKVAVNTKMPTNVVGASSLRRPRATSTSPIFLCLISQARGNYDSGDCVKVVLSGGTITTVAGSTTTTTIAATTTTVAATTTTVAATTTTVAATTTTTTVPTKTLTVFGYGGGSAPSGTITMNPSVGATKTCTSLMTDCVGTFQVGATVAITVAVTSTGYYITWTPESFVEYNPGAIAAPAACPQVAESGPQPVGAEILPTGPGSLLCTFTMVASNTRFSYWVSGAAG